MFEIVGPQGTKGEKNHVSAGGFAVDLTPELIRECGLEAPLRKVAAKLLEKLNKQGGMEVTGISFERIVYEEIYDLKRKPHSKTNAKTVKKKKPPKKTTRKTR